MKQFHCGDVVSGCTATFRANDESGILESVAEHARRDHGIPVISETLVEAVRSHVVEVPSA